MTLTDDQSFSPLLSPPSCPFLPPISQQPSPSTYQIYYHDGPLPLTYSKPLPSFQVAYETWGTLNEAKSNTILLHTGLSASSHAASTPANPAPGWWEKFIGPGKALDTNKFFIVCCNALGGCYGTTGPADLIPAGTEGEGERWGTRFPVVSIFDMVSLSFRSIPVCQSCCWRSERSCSVCL